jgi:hypothetical protein
LNISNVNSLNNTNPNFKSQVLKNNYELHSGFPNINISDIFNGLANAFIAEVQAAEPSHYDPNSKYYHYYELNNDICSTTKPECTTDNVFIELKKYPAPGWDGSKSVKNGGVSEIGPLGVGGSVIHVVDEKNKQVTNVTLPGHIFEQGEVRRKVVEDNGKIKINTIGEGVNKSAEKNWLNMKTYREGVTGFVDGFADLDRAIKGRFEERYGK